MLIHELYKAIIYGVHAASLSNHHLVIRHFHYFFTLSFHTYSQNVEMISVLEDRIQESEVPSGSREGGQGDEVLYEDLQHSSSDSESHSDMDVVV